MYNSTFSSVVILGLILTALYFIWDYRRAMRMLYQWAEENGYQLVHSEQRFLRLGPFFWTTSRGQRVFHIEVIDPSGQQRAGYARCGSWWFGLFSNKVDVRWE